MSTFFSVELQEPFSENMPGATVPSFDGNWSETLLQYSGTVIVHMSLTVVTKVQFWLRAVV